MSFSLSYLVYVVINQSTSTLNHLFTVHDIDALLHLLQALTGKVVDCIIHRTLCIADGFNACNVSLEVDREVLDTIAIGKMNVCTAGSHIIIFGLENLAMIKNVILILIRVRYCSTCTRNKDVTSYCISFAYESRHFFFVGINTITNLLEQNARVGRKFGYLMESKLLAFCGSIIYVYAGVREIESPMAAEG